MLNNAEKIGYIVQTANAVFQKSTSAKTTIALTETALHTAEPNAMPKSTDSFDCAHVIEHYNNYTSAGTHSDTASYLNQPNSTATNQTKDDDMMLPWWLVTMMRNANPSSEWIKQMLEEAGIENVGTEKLSAAEELLENYGG